MSLKLERKVSVGVHVPTVAATALPSAEAYGQFFRDCEALGFDALWFEDRILHPVHLADPMLMLTWAAAHTRQMLLGSAVMVLNLRQAPVLARQLVSLNHLSNSRLVLGLSVGGRPDEYAALGITKRVAAFHENFEVLMELMRGEPVTHSGRLYTLQDAVVRPSASPPVLMGGIVDAALARAGRLADGWIMAPFGSLDVFRHSWDTVRKAAISAGRDAEALVAGRLLYVQVDDHAQRAEAELTRFLHAYYGPDYDVAEHAIYGPADHVIERLSAQIEAGITHLMLGVPSLDSAALRRLAVDVMPALRRCSPSRL